MIDEFKVTHCDYASPRSFEAVVAAFEQSVGDSQNRAFEKDIQPAADRDDFERRTTARLGDSGFTRFLTVDHGAWLPFYGVDAKCRMYTIGNPLIARTMLVHDIGAGLNVPVRITIYEDRQTGVTHFAYDQPSSLMSRLGNEEVTAAARLLDQKLADLAESVTGAKA